MSQSSTIAFFLLGGFVVFVTLRGQLPAYVGTVLGSSNKSQIADSGLSAESLFYNQILPNL